MGACAMIFGRSKRFSTLKAPMRMDMLAPGSVLG